MTVTTGQKKKGKHGTMSRNGGEAEEEEEEWSREDLLRLFPPWAEAMAGPDLAVCRLAGSILTLNREEEQ